MKLTFLMKYRGGQTGQHFICFRFEFFGDKTFCYYSFFQFLF